jgi:hypothetical protein
MTAAASPHRAIASIDMAQIAPAYDAGEAT